MVIKPPTVIARPRRYGAEVGRTLSSHAALPRAKLARSSAVLFGLRRVRGAVGVMPALWFGGCGALPGRMEIHESILGHFEQ
jgi:hypothetical protein